jgi:hypothetical protein
MTSSSASRVTSSPDPHRSDFPVTVAFAGNISESRIRLERWGATAGRAVPSVSPHRRGGACLRPETPFAAAITPLFHNPPAVVSFHAAH